MNALQRKRQFRPLMHTAARFLSVQQLHIIQCNVNGEEGNFFLNKMAELVNLFKTMPKTYEQDGKGDEAIVSLHYFKNGMDWYITERDQEEMQYQAFGLADLGIGQPELGYISIEEITDNGAEIDLHWTPKTLGEVKTINI